MRIVVVLPEPFDPKNPKISPYLIEKLTRSTATNFPKLREQILRHDGNVVHNLAFEFKMNIARDTRAQERRRIVDRDFHGERLGDPFLDGLNVARREFRLRGDEN